MHNYFVCYVVFLIYIVLVNGECTRDTTISNAEDCGNLCSIQDGIDDCLNRCPTDDDFVMCNIHLSSTPTGVFSGVGNANITIESDSPLKSLSFTNTGTFDVDGGFFIHSINALDRLAFETSTVSFTIKNSKQTAIKFVSDNRESIFTTSGIVSFENCHANGEPSVLLFEGYYNNTSIIYDINTASSSGDCGAISLLIKESATIELSLTATNVQSQSKGGLACIYAPEDVTITLADINTIDVNNAKADKGGVLYLSGPGNFEIVDRVTSYIIPSWFAYANIGGYIYAENFGRFTINTKFVQWNGDDLYSIDNGYIFFTSSLENSVVEIFDAHLIFPGLSVNDNGGGFYFENINEVSFRNVTIENGLAFYGVGGAAYFDSVGSLSIIDSNFYSNYAIGGGALACTGMDSKIDIQNTKFYGDLSSSLVYTSEDIYSDGTCTDSFWYSAHECESDCNSCESSVCGTSSTMNGDYCYCYCDTFSDCNYEIQISASITTFPSVSPVTSSPTKSISITPSITPTISVTSSESTSYSPTTSSEQESDSYDIRDLISDFLLLCSFLTLLIIGLAFIIFLISGVLTTDKREHNYE